MIKSMTGYGRGICNSDEIDFNIDMKSVNNKYLDIQIKMPYYLIYLEEDIKQRIKAKLNRGRVDVFIKDESCATKKELRFDMDLARQTYEALEEMRVKFGLVDSVSLEDILANKEIISYESSELDEDLIRNLVLTCIDEALEGLVEMRSKEGIKLNEDLLENIEILKSLVDQIGQEALKQKDTYRDKLFSRIEELLSSNSELDRDRLELEVAILAEKADINEELVRLNSHIVQFKDGLKSTTPVGKKLDFICQELNREVNTILSKSTEVKIKENAIEAKAIVDKLKEQVQNVE